MKTILQQNKDLDLRRYGKDLYTKAKEFGGESSGDIEKQIAEAFINNIFKERNESVPSNLVYPDFVAISHPNFDTNEDEITIIDSSQALVELLFSGDSINICLYRQKPFETSPYTITGNESKVYMVSRRFYPTILFDNTEYKVGVNEVKVNGETFYTVVEHMEHVPDPGEQL